MNQTHAHKLPGRNFIDIQCAILGCIFYLLLFGIKILDPTFISWLLFNDSATHFLGAHFFRSEPWFFPLGAIKSYIYPLGTSIVFTDSLPLLAFPLKLFSAILPYPFQYLGLWLLVIFILQGYFGAKLLRQITHNRAIIFIGVIFFLLSPIMIRRACDQIALASHWLILAALYLYLSPQSPKKPYTWLILLILASLIHFYLFMMAGAIWVAYLWRLKREGLPTLKMMAVTIGVTGVTMWGTGYFVIGLSGTSVPEYGVKHMLNLVAPVIPPPNTPVTFNPVKVLPGISPHLPGQKPGFNYLGLGAILMVTIALYQQLTHRQLSFTALEKHRPLLVTALVLFLLAITNKIVFYDSVLIEISLPIFLKKCLGVIRTGDRMFWPIAYLLIATSIAIISRLNSTKRATYIMALMLIIQSVDLWPGYKNINRAKKLFQNPLQSTEWNAIMNKIGHITIIPPERHQDDYIPFALLAANNKKTINIGYAGRDNQEQALLQAKDLNDFKEGRYSPETLYVMKKNYPYTPVSTEKFTSKVVDGYQIVYPATGK